MGLAQAPPFFHVRQHVRIPQQRFDLPEFLLDGPQFLQHRKALLVLWDSKVKISLYHTKKEAF